MMDANESSELQTEAVWCVVSSISDVAFAVSRWTTHICSCLHLKMCVLVFGFVYNCKSKHISTCQKLGSGSVDLGSGKDLGLVTLGLINNAESLSSAHTDWLNKNLHFNKVSRWLACVHWEALCRV